MPVSSSFFWNDGPMKAGLRAANYAAGIRVRETAAALNPAKNHIRVVGPIKSFDGDVQIIKGTGSLAHIFEGGRAGGYLIQPGLKTSTKSTIKNPVRKGSGKVVKFTHGDGGFAGGPFFGGAMAAHPYLHPAAALYPTFFRQAAPAALRSTSSSALGALFK